MRFVAVTNALQIHMEDTRHQPTHAFGPLDENIFQSGEVFMFTNFSSFFLFQLSLYCTFRIAVLVSLLLFSPSTSFMASLVLGCATRITRAQPKEEWRNIHRHKLWRNIVSMIDVPFQRCSRGRKRTMTRPWSARQPATPTRWWILDRIILFNGFVSYAETNLKNVDPLDSEK